MKIAFYNSMYSLNGKHFFSNIIGHWAVHFQGDVSRIWKRTNAARTIGILKEANADIVGIGEIIEGQEKEIEEKLRELGYVCVFFGDGHRTKYNKLKVKVAVAAKFEGINKEINNFPTINELGGGGGFVSCYFPELELTLICVHFSLARHKELYSKQVNFVRNHIEQIKGKIVLLGDFNKKFEEIKSYFPDLVLASGGEKTCSTTPILNKFHFSDDDHIFVENMKVTGNGCIPGYSDHKLIYAELI